MTVSRPGGVIVIGLVAAMIGAVAVMASASPSSTAGARSGIFVATEAGTVAVIISSIIALVLVVWALVLRLREQRLKGDRARALNKKSIWRMLVEQLLLPLYVLGAVLFSYFLATDVFSKRRRIARSGGTTAGARSRALSPPFATAHHSSAPWATLLIATVGVLVVGALLFLLWKVLDRKSTVARSPLVAAPDREMPTRLVARLNSVQRDDPDPRRTVLSAFADMEHLLSLGGDSRHSNELPRQYLGRRLASDRGLYRPAARLAELFEWARFSGHGVHRHQADEAVALLEEMRNRLASS